MDLQSHWQDVYVNKTPDKMSWTEQRSSLIDFCSSFIKKNTPIKLADIGCGISSTGLQLLNQGYTIESLDLLDISTQAILQQKQRLSAIPALFSQTHFHACSIIDWQSEKRFNFWHDRAVLHFLTDPADQVTYKNKLLNYLESDGLFAVATFAKEGPLKCSGLPIQQYDAQALMDWLGSDFQLLKESKETHKTPWESEQLFQFCLFRKV